MASADDIRRLVPQALDEFDECPLDVAVRRAMRIANLVGDSRTVVRSSLEIEALGGDKQANDADTRALMADPSLWAIGTGPAEEVMFELCSDRRLHSNDPNSNILTQSITELDFLIGLAPTAPEARGSPRAQSSTSKLGRSLHGTRRRVFTKLCAWARQYTYASINQTIFEGFQREVDRMLAAGAPDVIDQFSAVYRRMREAADRDPERSAAEELSQAITSCWHILKVVVDFVTPPSVDRAERMTAVNSSKGISKSSSY